MQKPLEHCLRFGELYVYYEKDCKLSHGERHVLFGRAYSYTSSQSPEKWLAERSGKQLEDSDIESELYTWGGRYALLYANRIYMDYAGLLGMYYYEKDGLVVISPSLTILHDRFGIEEIADKPSFSWGAFLNYFPAPLTMLEGVRKLINSQMLHIVHSGGGTAYPSYRVS